MIKNRITRIAVIGIAVIYALASGIYLYWRKNSAFVYATHQSPDSRFMIQVIEYPQLLGHLPGDSGSGGGFVQLIDRRTGKVLEKKSVDPVLTIDTVYWESDSVYVKLFQEWHLPE